MDSLIAKLKECAVESYIAAAVAQDRVESVRLMTLGNVLQAEARGLRSMQPSQTALVA